MQNNHQILDMTSIGMIFRVTKTSAQTNGRSLEMEWRLLPRAGGTPVHIHPLAKETYTVLEGQLELKINGRWQLLHAGDSLTIPEGTPHTFRNPTDNITRVYNIHAPALQFGEYFSGLCSIVQRLSDKGTTKLPMNLRIVTHLCMLMKKHRQELVSVNPPNFIVSLLSRIGKLGRLKI